MMVLAACRAFHQAAFPEDGPTLPLSVAFQLITPTGDQDYDRLLGLANLLRSVGCGAANPRRECRTVPLQCSYRIATGLIMLCTPPLKRGWPRTNMNS